VGTVPVSVLDYIKIDDKLGVLYLVRLGLDALPFLGLGQSDPL